MTRLAIFLPQFFQWSNITIIEKINKNELFTKGNLANYNTFIWLYVYLHGYIFIKVSGENYIWYDIKI